MGRIYERLLAGRLAARRSLDSYRGSENLRGLDPRTPVLFIFSHQVHQGTSLIGSEPRHLVNLANHFPDGPRRVRIIVRRAESLGGRIRQALSPVHVAVATREDIPDREARTTYNRKACRRIALQAKASCGRIIAAIAPDAGQTLTQHPQLVDPRAVSAGGLVMLIEEIESVGFSDIPIIPVALDHRTGTIAVGRDFRRSFRDSARDQKKTLIAEAINSAAETPHKQQKGQPRKPLKLALVTPYPLDEENIQGGVHSVAYALVAGLRRFGDLDIHVIHCHSEIRLNQTQTKPGLTVHFLAMSRTRIVPNTVKAIRRLTNLLRELQPDVVNAHQPHYALAGIRSGYPTVYTIHGIAHREAEIYATGGSRRLSSALFAYYDRRAVQKAQHLVAISPYVIREYGGRTTARWHQIDNPLPDDLFAVPRQVIPGRILFVGIIDERKDLLTLLKAVGWLRRRRPEMALRVGLAGGIVSPRYDRQLKEFVSEKGLDEIVSFLGPLRRSDLLRQYAAAEVVVLPSLQETRPMAILEAMAVGIPIVASRAAGIPDLVEEGITGLLFPPRDFAALAETISQLIEKPLLGRELGRRGKEKAEANFRAADVADKYRQVYETIAVNKPMSR